jgi:hypothetical protein
MVNSNFFRKFPRFYLLFTDTFDFGDLQRLNINIFILFIFLTIIGKISILRLRCKDIFLCGRAACKTALAAQAQQRSLFSYNFFYESFWFPGVLSGLILDFFQSAFMHAFFLLRLCRNYFCTCGSAAQKPIFAALPQNKDRKNALDLYQNASFLCLCFAAEPQR